MRGVVDMGGRLVKMENCYCSWCVKWLLIFVVLVGWFVK